MRRFNPEKELKKIQKGNRNKILYGIILLLLIISIGSTYALYQVRYSKRIIYTKVAPFSNKDIILTVLLDGETSNDFPDKEDGYYFDGLDCETKDVTTATWNYNLWALNLTSTKPNKCDVLFNKEPSLLIERIKFINDHKEENIATVADDDPNKNIRYIGATPNNYIWFNCDNYSDLTQETAEKQCEKWRIIGLMNDITIIDGNENTNNPTRQNLVKITRDENIGNIAWNTTDNNDWTNASLQKGLNGPYLKNPDNNTWMNEEEYTGNYSSLKDEKYKGITALTQKMIEKVRWNLGGWSTNIITTSQFYEAERGKLTYNSQPYIWDGYIGLMYPSDYGYSTSGLVGDLTTNREGCLNTNLDSWDNSPYQANCVQNSWLLNGSIYPWTLMQYSNSAPLVFGREVPRGIKAFGVRGGGHVLPTLYLKSNVKIANGDGSSTTPYILTQ